MRVTSSEEPFTPIHGRGELFDIINNAVGEIRSGSGEVTDRWMFGSTVGGAGGGPSSKIKRLRRKPEAF
ncbi:MAG TPA: hypothetical protein VLT51_12345 [Anaerolineales bacterium]|nr:hypothetical protein [Anaerolineales bacterium]